MFQWMRNDDPNFYNFKEAHPQIINNNSNDIYWDFFQTYKYIHQFIIKNDKHICIYDEIFYNLFISFYYNQNNNINLKKLILKNKNKSKLCDIVIYPRINKTNSIENIEDIFKDIFNNLIPGGFFIFTIIINIDNPNYFDLLKCIYDNGFISYDLYNSDPIPKNIMINNNWIKKKNIKLLSSTQYRRYSLIFCLIVRAYYYCDLKNMIFKVNLDCMENAYLPEEIKTRKKLSGEDISRIFNTDIHDTGLLITEMSINNFITNE